jgi:hypothetical protein
MDALGGSMAMAVEAKFGNEPDGFEYSPLLEADDPAFTRAMQAELHRRVAHAKANPDDYVDYETLKVQVAADV